MFMLTASAKSIIAYRNWSVCFAPGDSIAYYVCECDLTDSHISIPDSFDGVKVVGIDDHTFSQKTTLTDVTFSEYITTIGKYAFFNDDRLEYVTLNASLETIGESAFEGTTVLSSINLQDTNVSSIGINAFLKSGISRITLPDSCIAIGNGAFAQCGALEKILIPAGVTEISDTAFNLSENLTIYCYSDSYAHEYAAAKEIPFVLLDAPVEYTFILGDADGDGIVTIMDATRIQRVLADLVEDTNGLIALRAANGEALSIMHATRVQRWLVDYEVSAPIGTSVTCSIPYYLIF